jgi:hypothetical protein
MNGVLVRGASGVVRARGLARGAAPRRGLAAHANEPEVLWSDYRSGKVSLAEWVDGNRHVVAGGFFLFYCALAANAFRPKKNKKTKQLEQDTSTSDEASVGAATTATSGK